MKKFLLVMIIAVIYITFIISCKKSTKNSNIEIQNHEINNFGFESNYNINDLKEYKYSHNPVNPVDDYIESKVAQGANEYYDWMNQDEIFEVDEFVSDLCDSIIDDFPDDVENWRFKREIAIIKWFVENTNYSNNRGKGTEHDFPDIDYSAYGALINKEAVCNGFSHAFSLLCERCNIPVKKVVGPNHAWNVVMLDDEKWYHVDVTWVVCSGDFVAFVNLNDEQCRNLPNGASGINNHNSWTPTNVSANGDIYCGDYLLNYLHETYDIVNDYSVHDDENTENATYISAPTGVIDFSEYTESTKAMRLYDSTKYFEKKSGRKHVFL